MDGFSAAGEKFEKDINNQSLSFYFCSYFPDFWNILPFSLTFPDHFSFPWLSRLVWTLEYYFKSLISLSQIWNFWDLRKVFNELKFNFLFCTTDYFLLKMNVHASFCWGVRGLPRTMCKNLGSFYFILKTVYLLKNYDPHL